MPRYYTVKLCIALQNLAEGLEKPNFYVIFFKWNNKSLIRWLTYNTRGHFAHCSYFSSPLGARKNTTQLAKYPRLLYVKPSNKLYFSRLGHHTLHTSISYKNLVYLRTHRVRLTEIIRTNLEHSKKENEMQVCILDN